MIKPIPSLISQLLINLVKNGLDAVKATEHPRVHISARTCFDRAIIEVEDNGPGVATQAIQEIFVPFFTTMPEGSGIGLALSRKIIKAHGGILEYSRVNGLTRFTIDLPLKG